MDHVDISTGSKDEPMLWEINNLKLCRLCGITKVSTTLFLVSFETSIQNFPLS